MQKKKKFIGSSTVVYDGPVLTGGKGVNGYDIDGKDFLDFTGQISLLNTGYGAERSCQCDLNSRRRQLPACI